MALIYASAVNKRMNAPRQKHSVSDNSYMETSYTSHYRQRSNEDRVGHTNCAFEVPTSRERNQRKRSTSQNSCSNSSCCQTPPPNNLVSDLEHENVRLLTHQGINRSKTSAAELSHRLATIQNNARLIPRKISSPIMSQSVIYEPTFKQHLSMKNNLRKTLAKKRIVKETQVSREELSPLAQLAVSDESSDHNEDEEMLKMDPRSRRLSFDNINDKDLESIMETSVSVSSKPTVFQRMCNRFQKWKVNTHTT